MAGGNRRLLTLATGRYLGEGFDDTRPDTLFLTMPISWRGGRSPSTQAGYIGCTRTKGKCSCTITLTRSSQCWLECTRSGWRPARPSGISSKAARRPDIAIWQLRSPFRRGSHSRCVLLRYFALLNQHDSRNWTQGYTQMLAFANQHAFGK